jgi:hypothetical protein
VNNGPSDRAAKSTKKMEKAKARKRKRKRKRVGEDLPPLLTPLTALHAFLISIST